MELLSPAGGWDSLKVAVENGADAVYFGAGDFNARKRAQNFSCEDLSSAASFCHDSGVKAYLAANTLVKNHELGGFFSLMEAAYSSGIDAVIIQELSFASHIKSSFPGMDVHASTQSGIFNHFYKPLLSGVDRAILPREFTLSQLKSFVERTGIEAEVFVQGALCFSVSGQCLMSSFLGGRSANRGLCAQPCRKRYDGGFFLSTKDLCLVERLTDLEKAGVSAVKIEGRLRSPDYVAAATCLYRRALDSGVVDPASLSDLELAFSRGYTEGLMFKKPDVVTVDAAGKRGVFLGVLEKEGLIDLRSDLRIGDGVGFGSHGDIVRRIERNGREVDSAAKGSKVRLFLNAAAGSEVFLTSGVMRRNPCRFEKRKPLHVERALEKASLPETLESSFPDTRLLVKAYSSGDALSALEAGADLVFYNIFSSDYPWGDPGISPYIPRYLPDWMAEQAVDMLASLNPKSALSGDPGVALNVPGGCYLDISCNAFNDLDVSFYNEKNIMPILSPELSLKEIMAFRDKRFAVYAHGKVPLMSTKYALHQDCLRDDLGYVFPVRSESDYRQVLNSVCMGVFDRLHPLMDSGIRHFFLDLDSDVTETVSLYRDILSGKKRRLKGFTSGNYEKGVI